MLERYSHVRMEAKRTAMETLAPAAKRRVTTQTMTQTLCHSTFALAKLLD